MLTVVCHNLSVRFLFSYILMVRCFVPLAREVRVSSGVLEPPRQTHNDGSHRGGVLVLSRGMEWSETVGDEGYPGCGWTAVCTAEAPRWRCDCDRRVMCGVRRVYRRVRVTHDDAAE
jgi:hypothetical protein